MCFEYQRIKYQWNNGSKFSHLLTVRAEEADKKHKNKRGIRGQVPSKLKNLYSEFVSLVSDCSLLVGYEEEKASQQNHQATNTNRSISESKV